MAVQATDGDPVENLAREPIQQFLLYETLDNSHALIFVADEKMQYAAVNETACKTLCYTRENFYTFASQMSPSAPTHPPSTSKCSKQACAPA